MTEKLPRYEIRRSLDDDSSYLHSSSSRSSFQSDHHILLSSSSDSPYRNPHAHYKQSKSISKALRHKKPSIPSRLGQYFCSCTPRKCFRWFNLVILSSIVITVGTLARLSYQSAQFVHSGLNRPPPPPPLWEQFPALTRFYGGLKSLVPSSDNVPETSSSTLNYTSLLLPSIPKSRPYRPYAADHEGVNECFLDLAGTIKVPEIQAFRGVPRGMPDEAIGSYDVIGLEKDVCFDRYGKLGPYGFGYSKEVGGIGHFVGDREGVEVEPIDYRLIRWHKAQRKCLASNKARFKDGVIQTPLNHFGYQASTQSESDQLIATISERNSSGFSEQVAPKRISRKAIIIRTWHNYEYDDEDIIYLRSLISELSLKTGGEYTVHFLIDVKDTDTPVWADEGTYDRVLRDSLPTEFLGMGTLWSVQQMGLVYGNLPENHFRDLPLHGSYRSLYMPLAWFAYQHPEYEQFWQFEMDMRYTGHLYELLSKSSNWAAAQPRKYLWERNARYYIPAEHGSWQDFSHMVRVQTEHGTASKSNFYAGLSSDPYVPESIKSGIWRKAETPVWGPLRPVNAVLDGSASVIPPWDFAKDNNEWGVDEPADLMVYSPLFDPQGTDWLLADDTTGYDKSKPIPRRAAVTTFGSYSRRLLVQMHREMALAGKHMFTEMFSASVALHHGFKAVYVPHPVLMQREWPPAYMAQTFNGGRNGQSGGSRMSVFGVEREHNFRGTTWYYNAGFSGDLWRKWIGADIKNPALHEAGEEEEIVEAVEPEGRMCLRSLLFHPVKQVDFVS